MPKQPDSEVDSVLWESSNPPWGTVREVVIEARWAVTFDDLNNDLREVELNLFRKTSDGWELVAEQDDSGYPDAGHYAGADSEWAWEINRIPAGNSRRGKPHTWRINVGPRR